MNKYDSIESMIDCEGKALISPVGNSMLPFLKAGRDMVLLKKSDSVPRKYDVVLYRGKDGGYILHRIIRVKEKEYIICGDNSSVWEKGISSDDIIAVADKIVRGNKQFSCHCLKYKVYEHIWCGTLLKRVVFKLKCMLKTE